MKIGALRQTQLSVSSTGRGRCVCLLRLADFCFAPRRALAKPGALLRVAVDQICSAGRRPLAYLDGCPCSASPVSAAGSGSATQPTTAPCFVHWTRSLCLPPAPLRLFLPQAAPQLRSPPPTAVAPALRARPLTGALNHRLLPLFAVSGTPQTSRGSVQRPQILDQSSVSKAVKKNAAAALECSWF